MNNRFKQAVLFRTLNKSNFLYFYRRDITDIFANGYYRFRKDTRDILVYLFENRKKEC